MSILSSILPNPSFENLGGGRYKTNSTLAGQGVDSVAFVSGRKPLSLPTDALPGVSAPVPTTSQRPNRGSNVPIVYPRTASAYVQSGEIVFVDRYSDGGAPRPLTNPAMRGGAGVSNARVATIEQVNALLAAQPPVGAAEDILAQNHEARRWELDGVCLSIDSDDANQMVPGRGPTSDHSPYPLLNVVVQNHAPTLSDEDGELLLDSSQTPRSWTGPRIESRKVCPKGSAAGAVVYVGLFAEEVGSTGRFIAKLRRFCSSDITSGKEKLEGIQRAWQLGKVVDTNAAAKPRKVTIAVRVRRIDNDFVFDEGPPFITQEDIDTGDTRELRTPIDPERETTFRRVKKVSVYDRLAKKWK